MANRKISDLTALTAPATGDLLPIVDISEAAAADKNKKITYGELLASAPAGSAAAPSFSFDGDPNTGIFNPAADTLAFAEGGSEVMRITSAGLVGIGTTSPTNALLHVSSSTSAGAIKSEDTGTTGSFLRILGDAALGNLINWKTGTNLRFATSDDNYGSFSERMRITSAGNVGIGSTVPRALLDVGGSSAFNAGTYQSPALAVSNGYITIKSSANDGASRLTLIGDSATGDGTIDWGGTGNFNLKFTNNGSERFRCDSSGRLLVGTSTARTSVSVTPAFQVEGTSFDAASIQLTENTNDAQSSYLTFNKSRATSIGGNTVVQNNDNLGQIRFAGTDGSVPIAGATIQAQVDGTPGANDMPGRLMFSTTADGAASPTERMRIDSSGSSQFYGNTSGIFSASGASAGTTTALFVGRYSATSTQDGTTSFIVWSNGNVVNTNNSYGAISDLKLKENIVDAGSQWDDLKALQVRKYNFKEGQTHTQIGLVAQEAELVSPGLVSESPDRDEEGNDLGTVTKSVNYSVLYMKAVKALQEAMERIETLEARLTAAGIE
jgi:hypothetical protein